MTEKIVEFLLLLMDFLDVGVGGRTAAVTRNSVLDAAVDGDEMRGTDKVAEADEVFLGGIRMMLDVVNCEAIELGIEGRTEIAQRITIEEGVGQADTTIIFGVVAVFKKLVAGEEMEADTTGQMFDFADVMKITEDDGFLGVDSVARATQCLSDALGSITDTKRMSHPAAIPWQILDGMEQIGGLLTSWNDYVGLFGFHEIYYI